MFRKPIENLRTVKKPTRIASMTTLNSPPWTILVIPQTPNNVSRPRKFCSQSWKITPDTHYPIRREWWLLWNCMFKTSQVSQQALILDSSVRHSSRFSYWWSYQWVWHRHYVFWDVVRSGFSVHSLSPLQEEHINVLQQLVLTLSILLQMFPYYCFTGSTRFWDGCGQLTAVSSIRKMREYTSLRRRISSSSYMRTGRFGSTTGWE